jgi:hypothetical protein
MLLQSALIVMTIIVALFAIVWWRSPTLRRTLEEPKYRFFDSELGAEKRPPSDDEAPG